jgi:hypothetical protein
MSWFQKFGKSVAAGAVLVVTATQAAISDGHLTQAEDFQIAIAVVTALAVYFVPNVPSWPWAKTVVGVLLSALEVAVTLVDNGISAADWTAVILGGLTAITVGVAPAAVHRALPPARAGRPAPGVTSMPTTADKPIVDR